MRCPAGDCLQSLRGMRANGSRDANVISSPIPSVLWLGLWSIVREFRTAPLSDVNIACRATDGAPEVFKSIRRSHPELQHVFADGGYAGPKLRDALAEVGNWTIEIVKRSDGAEGFEVIPRRWVVERTFAWLNRCRRLAKDWEKTIESSKAWILIAHIRTLTRRIAKHCYHA